MEQLSTNEFLVEDGHMSPLAIERACDESAARLETIRRIVTGAINYIADECIKESIPMVAPEVYGLIEGLAEGLWSIAADDIELLMEYGRDDEATTYPLKADQMAVDVSNRILAEFHKPIDYSPFYKSMGVDHE